MAGPDCVIAGFENIDPTMDVTISVVAGVVTATDGSTSPALTASWAAFTNPYITGLEFQYLISSGPGAYTDSTAKSTALGWADTAGVISGAIYSIRYRATGNNVVSDWSNWISVTIPGAPSVGVPGPGSWAATGTIGGETGTAPILTVTGAVDQPLAASVIVEYRQILTAAPTYGPWTALEFPASMTHQPINVGTKGDYQVHIYYRSISGVADPSHYLDLGAIAVGVSLSDPPADITNLTTVYVAGITKLAWTFPGDYRPIDFEVRQGATWTGAQVLTRVADPTMVSQGDGTYWVAAHYTIPNGGGEVYSANPQSILLVGTQLTTNIVAAWDEFSTGWTGTIVNGSISATFVETTAGSATGSYTIDASHRIDIGRVAPCNVVMSTQITGQSVTDDVLAATDFLSIADLAGGALGVYITATPQIRVALDNVPTWGAWVNWAPGAYIGRIFDFRVLLNIINPAVIAVLQDLYFAIDVPTEEIDYVEHSLAAGGETFVYPYVFNGGPGSASKPNIQVTVVGTAAGDQVLLTGTSTTGFTLRVLNAGAGVARTVNIQVKGY